MAFDCKVGSFSLNTSTGTQSVTGVGFQPKALILWASDQTADGSGADIQASIGFGTSSTNRGVSSANAEDNQATSDRNCQYDGARILIINTAGTSTTRMRADIESLDADGFTLDIEATDAVAYQVGYMAIGGTDLSNATVLTFTSAASTGNTSYTGAGFQPDCVLFAGARTTDSGPCLGAALSSSAEWISMSYGEDNAGTSETASYQVSTSCVGTMNASNTFQLADFVSMDADGFTLNWSKANGASPGFHIALCLKGGSYAVGQATQKTSTGTQATTGVGFQPKGLLLASINNTATTSAIQQSRWSAGFASGTSARGCIWGGSQDNVGTTVCDHDIDTAAVLKMLTEGTPTLNAEADLSSFDSDGFTLNWTTADATAREFNFLAFGDTGGGGGGTANSHYYMASQAGAVA
jgi:hypothetical protein